MGCATPNPVILQPFGEELSTGAGNPAAARLRKRCVDEGNQTGWTTGQVGR